MEIKPAHIITVKKGEKSKDYHLSEPTWEVYKMAMQKYLSGEGSLDLVGAGEVIVDACYQVNQEPLDELKSDIKVFAMLCLRASSIVEFYEAEIKKN